MIQPLFSVIEFIFWLVFSIAFLHTFLTHFILWIELRLLSLQAENQSIPWAALIKSFVIEFFCLFAACLLYPFYFWRFKSHVPSTDTNGSPILLIHGYLHHQIAWIWFLQLLRKKDKIGPVYSINLLNPFTSIAKLAEQVKVKCEVIQREMGEKPIILIGHSMGGLVASYFCEYLAAPDQVAKIITLGTPFKGSWAAALAIGDNGREMAPESPFLKNLMTKIQQSPVSYFCIAGKIDNLVIPWQSALISEADQKRNHIFEDYGHLRLLISPQVVDQVAEWIATERK